MDAAARQDLGIALLDDLVAEGAETLTSEDVRLRLDLSPSAASNLLGRLTRDGFLERVRPGRYAIRGLGVMGTPAAAENLAVAVAAAFGAVPHRIGYRSALDELDLLTHPSRTVQVAAVKRVRLREFSGRTLRVIVEPANKIGVGAIRRGPSWLSSLERALLDAARRPELVGGTAVLVEAIATASPKIDPARLSEYAAALDWGSALRRIGSIADRLEIKGLAGRLEPIATPTADLDLEPKGEKEWSSRDRRWWVRWNRDVDELRAVIDR
jgi:predicted transcriptional regulator of viral defense system